MRKILLISEDTIKTYSELPDNVWGKSLMPAIASAQEIGLQSILGENLYNKILDKVEDGTITGATAYKAILDNQIQDYLIYKVLCDLVPILSTKIGNMGAVVSNDEHVVNLSQGERDILMNSYQYKADFYTRRLQNYLLKNRTSYPELDEATCYQIKENLKSATNCGIWTGGYRNPSPFNYRKDKYVRDGKFRAYSKFD